MLATHDLFRSAPPMIELRDYQREAIEAVLSYWAKGGGNPLVDMATGTGKSVVIGTLIRELLHDYPDMRVLKLVHVRELVEQNAKALLSVWPGAPIGINSAGLGRRDRAAQILFANIQSVYRDDANSLGPRDLVLIDEAHLVPRSGEGMYLTLLEKLRERVPDLRVCGFTATPYRLDSGRMDHGGDGRLFDKAVYSYGIARGVADGYLSPLISKGTGSEIDVSGVAKRGGEFVAGELERAANVRDKVELACKEICERGADRRGWLVFCAGVSHAGSVREALRERGIHAETVTAETPSGERDRIFSQFKAGHVRALTGMNVFTTGFDAPHVDLIACLRPTLSTGLYVQMLGRGTRIASGKDNCLVLDFAGNVRRHGPVDDIYIAPKGSRGGTSEAGVRPETVRARVCPACDSWNAISARKCRDCGFEWPVKHEAVADTAPVMNGAGKKWLAVNRVSFFRHEKSGGGGPPSLRVEYECDYRAYREWICFEHRGFAKAKAAAWWRMMVCGGIETEIPKTVAEAIERQSEIYDPPAAITVKRDGKYHTVAGYRFEVDGGANEYDEKFKPHLADDDFEAAGFKRSSRDAYIARLKSRRLLSDSGGGLRAADILF